MASSVSSAGSSQRAIYAPATPTTQQARSPQPAQDTVKLSQTAEINQLSEEGQTAKEIAEALGVPVSTVDADLGIVATATAAATG
jgi:DNA-binding NarL/FixJ family response regulator